MRKVVFMLLAGFYCLSVAAQEEELSKKEQRKLAKAERKAKKKEEQNAAWAKVNSMVENKRWVLEANQLIGKQGQTVNLISNVNFVYIIGDLGTVQLSFPNVSSPGFNNIGGITIEGKVTKYEYKKRGNGGILSATIFGSGASMDIIFTPDPFTARCEVRSSTTSKRITFTGVMKLPEESSVYKGRKLF